MTIKEEQERHEYERRSMVIARCANVADMSTEQRRTHDAMIWRDGLLATATRPAIVRRLSCPGAMAVPASPVSGQKLLAAIIGSDRGRNDRD
jgi:hypothetical protein